MGAYRWFYCRDYPHIYFGWKIQGQAKKSKVLKIMLWEVSLDNISIITYAAVFAAGFFICFTPCVYPIMPVIIGYLGGTESQTKKEIFFKALNYILGLAFVYSALGAVAAFTGGLFGRLQSGFWINFIVANIFIIFGLFMLDVFQMPKIAFFQRIAGRPKAGLGGAFLMGGISGLVVGPCTTPVLGGILAYVAAKQNPVLGVTLLFTYAIGMGVPLLIIGTFVGILKKLPKSGAWMLKVKKVFGILLIAVGEYLLIYIK
ncbi:MAG: hypothetical protein GY853_10970 [PVC group bacterium]|nr:hypothetical protein [PVC group bacterium]